MSRYQAYSNLKDSGEEWLGLVPAHWDVIQIKHLSIVKRGASPRPIDDQKYFDEEGEYAWTRISDVTASDVYLTQAPQRLSQLGSSLSVKLEPGSLFLSIAGTVGKPCIAGIKACIHDGFVYFPDLKIPSKFLFYIFAAEQAYKGLGKFGTQLNLNTDTVGGIKIGCTRNEELEKIVSFLDHETAKIDALIEKQQRLIELLKEKRQAVISHAVIKGLNPNASMKDSGVEWLGKVPAHWVVLKLGYLMKFKGGAGFPDSYQGQDEHEIPFYKVGDLARANSASRLTEPLHTITRETAKELRATIFDIGSIAFAKVGAALLLKRFCVLDKPSCLDNNMIGAGVGSIELRDFLLFLMPLLDFELIVNPGAVPSINGEQISSILVAIPSIDEQIAIVDFLKTSCSKFDHLISGAEHAISLFQERRTALISAAVTGKIDVRDWQAIA